MLGFAGALYAHYNAYIAPEGFAPLLIIYIVLALTAGGVGAMRGAIVGALFVVLLLEGTRFIALFLILLLRFRPLGLIPERMRTRFRQKASA